MIRGAAPLLLCCMVTACSESIDERAQHAYELTRPVGAAGTGVSLSCESTQTTATWWIRPMESWDAYAAWVQQRLMADFGPVAKHEAMRLFFRRTFEGDVHTLEIEPGTDGRGPYVSVRFTARPF